MVNIFCGRWNGLNQFLVQWKPLVAPYNFRVNKCIPPDVIFFLGGIDWWNFLAVRLTVKKFLSRLRKFENQNFEVLIEDNGDLRFWSFYRR